MYQKISETISDPLIEGNNIFLFSYGLMASGKT